MNEQQFLDNVADDMYQEISEYIKEKTKGTSTLLIDLPPATLLHLSVQNSHLVDNEEFISFDEFDSASIEEKAPNVQQVHMYHLLGTILHVIGVEDHLARFFVRYELGFDCSKQVEKIFQDAEEQRGEQEFNERRFFDD